jgi:hypothetical protein
VKPRAATPPRRSPPRAPREVEVRIRPATKEDPQARRRVVELLAEILFGSQR